MSPTSDAWVAAEAKRRESIVGTASLAAALLTAGLAGARWLVDGPRSQVGAMLTLATALFAAATWLVRRAKALRGGGTLLLGTALATLWSMAMLEEGLSSEAMLWLPFMALSASFFQGARSVLIWGGLALLAVGTIAARDLAAAGEAGRGLIAVHASSAFGAIVFAAVLGWRVEQSRTNTQRTIVSTELRRLEEHLARQTAENERVAAIDAIRSRDEFFSIASHELNTPLTSLKLMVQMLHRGSVKPDAMATALARIERQVEKLSRLIDELLSVSRIQAGRLHLELEDVDVAALTRELVERFGDDAARAHSPLLLRCPSTLVGHWDRMRLDQVLSNLIANALKFGRGQPIEIAAERANGVARLTVADHGIGIPPDRLPHIFERFERAVPASQYAGLGLGLYIVSQITSALGGTVRAESTPGAGSVFTLDLPVTGPQQPAPSP